MRPAIEHCLRKTGRSLVGAGGLKRLHRYRIEACELPEPAHSSWNRPVEFEVDLDKVTTPCGFSYHHDGWHPYVDTLTELLDDPELPYGHTTLCRFYARFQPTTVQQAVLSHVTEPFAPIHRWPAVQPLFKQVWAQTPRTIEAILRAPEGRRPGHQQFGPQAPALGRLHMERLLRVHNSVRISGYRPAAFDDDALTGYFLVRDGAYRFVVFNGNHRLAAFRQHGLRRVVARLHRDHPPVVNAAELSRWTVGRRATLPPEVAERWFDTLFTERGDAKAEALGIR